jgi:hypothetical protein
MDILTVEKFSKVPKTNSEKHRPLGLPLYQINLLKLKTFMEDSLNNTLIPHNSELIEQTKNKYFFETCLN